MKFHGRFDLKSMVLSKYFCLKICVLLPFLSSFLERKNKKKSRQIAMFSKNSFKLLWFHEFFEAKSILNLCKVIVFQLSRYKTGFLLFPDRWIITERNYWISSVAVSSSFTNRRHIEFQKIFEKLRLLLQNKNVSVSFLGRYASWPYGPSKYSDDPDFPQIWKSTAICSWFQQKFTY